MRNVRTRKKVFPYGPLLGLQTSGCAGSGCTFLVARVTQVVMKLVYSCVYKTGSTAPGKEGPVILSSAAELSSFGYFQRSSIKEMFVFFSRTFAKNVSPGQRTSVKQEGFLCHLYCSPGGARPCVCAEVRPWLMQHPCLRQASPPCALRTPSTRRVSRSATCPSCARTSRRPRAVGSLPPTRTAAWTAPSRCGPSPAVARPLPAWLAPTRAPRPRQAHPKLLQQFQDPSQADQLTRIMNELEQTKVRSAPGEPAAREES